MALLLLLAGILTAPHSPAAPTSFDGSTIAEAERFIAENSITSLPDFISRLPELTRASFVLMRASASLQPTKDPLRPRAILFGADGKLIFAFNHTSNSIEMMESPSGAGVFEFKRLNFTPAGAVPVRANCQNCHNGRPLWGQYRNWAGMYGGDQERIPTGSAEDADYRAFAKFAVTDALYQNLIFKCGTTYNGGMNLGFVDKEWEGGAGCRSLYDLLPGGKRDYDLERRLFFSGEAMGDLLNRQNASRIFQRVKASEVYGSLKYAIAANMLGCMGERIYDHNVGDPAALAEMRAALKTTAVPIETKFQLLAQQKGVKEKTLQASLMRLAGIDIQGDLRMDIRFDKRRFLGNDCDTNSSYSPNPLCQPGNYGYDGFFDGSEMGAQLVAYLMLRDIYSQDTSVKDKLGKGLEATRGYFESQPPGSGEGYRQVEPVLRALGAVAADLNSPAANPAQLPRYMNEYAFGHMLRRGGESTCRALLAGADQGLTQPSWKKLLRLRPLRGNNLRPSSR